MITFSDAIKTVFRKYVEFRGRATRAEYWWWQLFYAITFGPLYLIGGILLTAAANTNDVVGTGLGGFFVLVSLLWVLALVLPSLAVLVRRIRDAGYSPYLVFLGLIPYAGGIVLFVFSLLPSRDQPTSKPLAPVATLTYGSAAQTASVPAAYCSQCGNSVAGAAFCSACGAKVGA